MRWSRPTPARTRRAVTLAVLALLSASAPAAAQTVRVLGPHGRVVARDDPFLSAAVQDPLPPPARRLPRPRPPALAHSAAGPSGGATPNPGAPPPPPSPAKPHSKRRRHHRRKPPPPTPPQLIDKALLALERSGQLAAPGYEADVGAVASAWSTEHRLHGTPAAELAAVIDTLATLAHAGQMTAPRLPVLMLTLQRNVQWWSSGSPLSYGDRVEFSGSQLVWEYYPGQGLQLQPLASFGKADGLYTAGAGEDAQLRSLLDELVPLAVPRGGAPAWEYYFSFEGGSPPWVSAMTQGTAIEALTRGYRALGDSSLLALAHSALGLFELPPPAGVRVPTAAGARYVQYSFAPGRSILNAFLQSLIGLYDYAQATGDAGASALFDAGNAEALSELPSFDTGAWSLYEPGIEDSLDYHELVTGFLDQLCTRTGTAGYCQEAARFHAYLTEPPALSLLTQRLRAGKPGQLRFTLSKRSHVGVAVSCAGHTALYTSAWFPYGRDDFAFAAPRHRGGCTVVLTATDLAGNYSRSEATLTLT